MSKIKTQHKIGYFLERNDIFKISVVDLLQEIQYHLFEAHIIQLATTAVQRKQLLAIDCSIGDWKCQTRTSLLTDIIDQKKISVEEFVKTKLTTESLMIKLKTFFQEINAYDSIKRKSLTQELNNLSLFEFLQKHNLTHHFSDNIKLISLCFLTTTENHNLDIFHAQLVSTNKMKALINQAKKKLCLLSIEHEQNLAKKYGNFEQQKCLDQIEFKGMQHMTSLFAGFYSIFKKMKFEQQPFLTHTIKFCSCGGVLSNPIKFFLPKNHQYIELPLPEDQNQGLTIIEAYQFPGTLHQLQDLLNISHDIPRLPKNMFKKCNCKHPTQHPSFDSIDEAIMAFFAQHPQFTNGAEINWEGLGLQNSELKKEYDYLKTLKGFSREDMSKFQIIHMYPSTIADVLKEQEELQKQLGLPVTNK